MSDNKTGLQEIKEAVSSLNLSLSEILVNAIKFEKISTPIFKNLDSSREELLSIKEVDEKFTPVICSNIDKWEKAEKYKPILEELFRKEQEKQQKHSHQHEEEDSDPSDELSPENQQKAIDALKQLIIELQNQIEELKQNQNNSTDNDQVASQVENLQEEKRNVENELKQLQSNASFRSTSSPTTTDTSSSTNKEGGKGKGFPLWGTILIVLGVIVAAGTAAYFILEKKERPKPKKSPAK